jgi:hypothetical protein
MRAVWSLWTKPMLARPSTIWLHERSHWLSWVLSVETARRHYPEVALVTDREGARVLVEEIGLRFTEVSTELDALDGVETRWWAIGKLFAHRAQRAPYVHVDADAYLWNRLPAIVEHAPVLAQSPEPVIGPFYDPWRLHDQLERMAGGAPEAWTWYLRHGRQIAACCGIVGGQDVGLLRSYAELAIDVALSPRYRAVWKSHGTETHMVTIEQYLLPACVAHRRAKRGGGRDVYLQYLFPSASFDRAKEVGYTHVIGYAKWNPKANARVEEVVRRDYPALYRRCIDYSERVLAAKERSKRA